MSTPGFDLKEIGKRKFTFAVKNNDKCCRCCSMPCTEEMYAQNISKERKMCVD